MTQKRVQQYQGTQQRPKTPQYSQKEPRNNLRGSSVGMHGGSRKGGKAAARKRRIEWKRFFPALVLLAVFVYASVSLIRYAANSRAVRQTNEALQAIYEEGRSVDAVQTAALRTNAPEPAERPYIPGQAPAATPEPQLPGSYQYIGNIILPELYEMHSRNPDTVAWLRIPGVVDLPVVYRDNYFYLDHDFYGRSSSSGAIFLDEAHPFAEDTQYMVVHGHDMFDGSMFGRVAHYRTRSFMEQHPTVYWATLYRQEEYEVIAVLDLPVSVQSEGYVPYTGSRKFRDAGHFYSFARNIREHALYWKEGAEMLPEDALLALSTCYEERRVVVMCRRVNY